MSETASTGMIAAIVVALWYGLAVFWIVRKKGLDPTYATHVSPLNFMKYNFATVLIGLAGVGGLISVKVVFIGWLLMFLALAHLLLLEVFGRAGTQPVQYYLLVGLSGLEIILVPSPATWPLYLLTLVAQLAALYAWSRRRTRKYNDWVARKVRRLHKKYGSVAEALTPYEWFYVLHFAVTESIARPKLSRLAESLYFYVKKPPAISSGIMQVKADTILSDMESMRRGAAIVCQHLRGMPPELTEPLAQLRWLARQYNGSRNEQANADYTGFLLSTYPGLVNAWESIKK